MATSSRVSYHRFPGLPVLVVAVHERDAFGILRLEEGQEEEEEEACFIFRPPVPMSFPR